jgi:peptidoglycan-associated lipoprotein
MKILRFCFFAICLCSSTVAFTQKAVERADKAFELQQYNYAATLYQRAFSRVGKNEALKNRINYQIAESYRLSGQYRKAIPIYRRAIKARHYEFEPKVYLHLAEILRFSGEYEEATTLFENYLELMPDDENAKQMLEACRMTAEWLKNPTRHMVENIRKINSRANDWAPRFLDRTEQSLVFTSAREGATGKKLDDWTGQRFTDLFISSIDKKGDWSTPVLLDNTNVLNTHANEADAFFINNGNTVFFTYCASQRKKQSGCLIFTSQFDGDKWSDPEYVHLTSDSIADCVHPWVSADGRTIIFSSNMEGGYGDLDLWMATRDNANSMFGDPINLGPNINTSSKEGWPFLRDSLLYFSSTGHPGLGGFDIFVSVKTNDGWGMPENMGVPINSSADDFGIMFATGQERGFFSSNRNTGRQGQNRSDDDIWSFVLPSINFTISGAIRDDETMQLVPQALVQIVGSDGLSVQAFTNNRGFYRFDETQIKQNVTYKLWVSKSGYMETEATETTVGLNNGRDIVRDFRIQQLPKGAVVLPDILYALGRWDLQEQYQDSLMGLIELMERNPRLVIELASHTDSRPIAMTNDSLSQYRAQEVVNYLISRGIHPARLMAKGYGARAPRVFLTDLIQTINGITLTLPAGTILTDEFINDLPRNQQEMAHQLNRRTEFSILRDDFIPPAEGSATSIDVLVRMASVDDDKRISFRINPNGLPEIPLVVNGTSFTFVYDENAKQNLIGTEEAMRLLRTGKINRNDFKDNERAFDEEGDIVKNALITLRELRIGKTVLQNISVMVAPELPAPLILNAETLKSLGEFTINRVERVLELK